MITGLVGGSLHKSFSVRSGDNIKLIEFIEKSIYHLNSLNNDDLKSFDVNWTLDFIRDIKPIYEKFSLYRENKESDFDGYIVIDIDEIGRDVHENTIELYSINDGRVSHYGSFFSNSNLNIKNILNYKIVYSRGDKLINMKWLKEETNHNFNVSIYSLINYLFGFIYVDLNSDALVDTVVLVDNERVCFNFNSN